MRQVIYFKLNDSQTKRRSSLADLPTLMLEHRSIDRLLYMKGRENDDATAAPYLFKSYISHYCGSTILRPPCSHQCSPSR